MQYTVGKSRFETVSIMERMIVATVLIFLLPHVLTSGAFAFQGLQTDWDCSGWEDVANENNVHFRLFTKANKEVSQPLKLGNVESITNSNFDASKEVVFYIHGFIDGHDDGGSKAVKDEYMRYKDVANFVVVDWCALSGTGVGKTVGGIITCPAPIPAGQLRCNIDEENPSSCPAFVISACNTKPVGDYLARFIQFLVAQGFTISDKIHLVGHGLGSHVAGVTGHQMSSDTIRRITGLDPSLPWFGKAQEERRLGHEDAEFVDVIHTSGRVGVGGVTPYSLGMLEPIGHKDFYPNGGVPGQPGCAFVSSDVPCSAPRAWVYYAESINVPASFLGCQCSDWGRCEETICEDKVVMGMHATAVTDVARGRFYALTTNAKEPFGRGRDRGCVSEIGSSSKLVNNQNLANLSAINAICVNVFDTDPDGLVSDNDKLLYTNCINPTTRFPIISSSFLDNPRSDGASVGEVSDWRTFINEDIQAEDQPACCSSRNPPHFSNFRKKAPLTPNNGWNYNKHASRNTFFCPNAAPQDEYTHEVAWARLEAYILKFAEYSGQAYIFTGTSQSTFLDPVAPPAGTRNQIPHYFWKVACVKMGNMVLGGIFYASNNEVYPLTHQRGSPQEKCNKRDEAVTYRTWNQLNNIAGVTQADLIKEAANLHSLGAKGPAFEPFYDDCFGGGELKRIPVPQPNPVLSPCSLERGVPVDETLVPFANGRPVVSAVDRKIKQSNVFQNDFQFLFRFAYAVSGFGEDLDTFPPGYPGGIWKISLPMYEKTLGASPALKSQLRTAFGIDWDDTNWTYMLTPLYGGLAMRILIEMEMVAPKYRVPMTIAKQAVVYHRITGLGTLQYINRVGFYYQEYPTRGKYNLIVSLDGSGSIGAVDYQTAKVAVAHIMKTMREGSEDIKLALILFSSGSEVQIKFGNGFSGSKIYDFVLKMYYPNSGTNTHLAIDDSISQFAALDDDKSPRVVILLTDGQSNNPSLTATAAQRSKASDIITFSVGLGSNTNQAELLLIAGGNEGYVFQLDEYTDLLEMHLWLNTEVEFLPRTPAINDRLKENVGRGEQRFYKVPRGDEGTTVFVKDFGGATSGYYSYGYETPTEAYHGDKLDYGWAYFPSQSSSVSRNNEDAYLMVKGEDVSNPYEIQFLEGYHESCGLKGIKTGFVQASTALELSPEGTVLWEGAAFGYSMRSGGAGVMSYPYTSLGIGNDGRFQVLAMDKFKDYVNETGFRSITENIQMGCGDGTMKEYVVNIPIKDENNLAPEFQGLPSNPIVVSPTHDVSIPIASFRVIDKDIDLQNAAVAVWTQAEENIRVKTQAAWDIVGGTPKVFEYTVDLYLRAIPDELEPLSIEIVADDGVNETKADISLTFKD